MSPSRTAMVTGATDGLGRAVARRLAGQGYAVIAHGRDEARGNALVAEIEASGGSAWFRRADFSSLEEVRALAASVLGEFDRIDLLVSNAGVGPGGPQGRRELSADGIELRLAVNYLAGYLLNVLLEPALLAAAPGARIVNVASAGQEPIDFDDPMMQRHYERELAYCRAKLAQIMGSFDLAERLAAGDVTVNAVHPATFMPTTMVRETGFAVQSSLEEGVEAVLNVALSLELEARTGLYFDGLSEAPAHPFAYDSRARERLRLLTGKLLAAGNHSEAREV